MTNATLSSPHAKWRGAPYLWLLGVFAASRLAYYAAGVRFDITPLNKFFQIFDPLLLRTRLFETLYYAHTYPPGFNLMIGVILKLFPESYTGAFHALYMGFGIVIAISLFEIMRALDVGVGLATGITCAFMASPGIVLYENFLLYEYPMLALLCLSAWCLYALVRRPSARLAFGFFLLVAILVTLRSMFHLGFFLLALAVLWIFLKPYRRMLLLTSLLPFLLAFSTYAKNWATYGTFSNSSWMGFNIYTLTTHQLTGDEMERFIQEGKISPVERIETLGALSAYRDFVTLPPPTGIPILDQQIDSTGRPNFNQLAYGQLQKIYLTDGKFLLFHYPRAYLRSVVKAWFAYFLPATDFPFFGENRTAVRRLDRAVNIIVFGQFKEASDRKDLRKLESAGASVFSLVLYTGMFLLVGLPILFVFGCWKLWRLIQAKEWPQAALLGFVIFNIVMITGIVNSLSCFENNRYRVPIDGFFTVLAALALQSLLQRRRTSAN